MYIIKNVFTDGQRYKLIKDCQPLLLQWGKKYPGRQTHSQIHLHPDFISPIQEMVRIIFQETGFMKDFILTNIFISILISILIT